MKYIFFSLLLSFITSYVLAESPAMNNQEATASDYSTENAGKQYYIRDYIYVPLRSGESAAYRVIHKGLKSGTMVTLNKQGRDSGYSLVTTSEGLEGWLPSQYLMTEPTAAIQLAQAQARIKQMVTDMSPNGARLLTLEDENDQLKQKLQVLKTEFEGLSVKYTDLTKLSSDTLRLDQDYQKLLTTNQNNKITIDTLTVENDRLKSKLRNDDFINGAIVLFLAVLLLLIAQFFIKSRNRSSEWR